MSLAGRVAVVTGGAGHIGAAACAALAEAGAAVAVVDIDQEGCRSVAADISASWSTETLALCIDLADEKRVRSVPESVMERFGHLDILVNCAAFVGSSDLTGWAVDFPSQNTDSWHCAMEVNLTAAFILTQSCAPALAESGNGTVVNVSSIYGMVGPDMRLYEGTGMGNPAAYAAGKGGIIQLTRWLATTLAPHIRVNAISPGGVFRGQPEIFVDRYVSRTPIGRMATEEDLKGAVLYLASDLSSYVTGHNLVVDGGWTAW